MPDSRICSPQNQILNVRIVVKTATNRQNSPTLSSSALTVQPHIVNLIGLPKSKVSTWMNGQFKILNGSKKEVTKVSTTFLEHMDYN